MIEVCMIEDMTSAKFFDTTGKRIRILREDRELNQTELARRMAELGVGVAFFLDRFLVLKHVPYLSQIEGDSKTPRLPVLAAIARALETTTDYLLLLSDEPSPPAGGRCSPQTTPPPRTSGCASTCGCTCATTA